MAMEGTHCFSRLWACLWILLAAQRGAMASMFWTATVKISYRNLTDNQTVQRMCECGVFGYNSAIGMQAGQVELPGNDPLACDPNTTFIDHQEAWVALIKRGTCAFTEKVQRAAQQGASAVVVYNLDGTGNETSPMYLEDKIKIAASNGASAAVIFNEADTGYSVIQMSHPGTEGIVAIMIGNSWGTEIVSLINSGVQVNMAIAIGNPHGPWMSQYSLILVSLSFFVVTAVTVGYFIFHSARRLCSARAQNRKLKLLKVEAKKAITKLQVRTLQQGDQEIGPEADSCAVCIESYKPGDVVSVLTCSHVFHKMCIEPWLLEHRTCPMCKCDILKSLGIEVEREEPEHDGNEVHVAVLPDMYPGPITLSVIDDTRSEAASSGYASVYDSEYNMPRQNQQNRNGEGEQLEGMNLYDNPAFEGDSQSPLETKS
ncbi:hypothetical protein SKAU_G00229060 [Synaphobranchus kaupii]|uniref:RING-type domain-containing protein n=1 Tax=Synaphobranchus kaupii TaxID=118154 RepID=A0A9Q1IS66_SYNKA|nr:hypothetical protein SKAU_G00229060 [Synaphobranchus kaupii]